MRQGAGQLAELLARNRAGEAVGVYAVCSAHPYVLEASLLQAREDGSILLVEATSNQVDQFGGYTGMKPRDFAASVAGIAEACGFPRERLLLGGDHLGPNSWRGLEAAQAMERACALVAEYVKAGFRKIHLDASMFLADDPGDRRRPLADEVVARRAAALGAAAEAAAAEAGATGAEARPVYVIGTEVPIPGGARERGQPPSATRPEDAARSIEITRAAFRAQGLESAWERVVALVVQPAVEFGEDFVFDYDRRRTGELSRYIESVDQLVYEAHSTDYQPARLLRQMVEDHFCILKVGPALSFAFREAVFALDMIEAELAGGVGRGGRHAPPTAGLREALEGLMLENPQHWQSHYHGDRRGQALARRYSFSDRSRYYWADPRLRQALSSLIDGLSRRQIPLSLLSQYLPRQYRAVREGEIPAEPKALILHKIREVTADYSRACGFS
jgi:D-tagatose-1,6-bisphosphate aldolase subunit GatZ/KbaZ